MGEMMTLFAASDVAFVAGSFVPVGGHNVIEPAALQKPVITGPYLFNFAEITDAMIKAGGMRVVHNAQELADMLMHFFIEPHAREKMGANAFSIVEKNRGALRRQLDFICGVT